MKSTTKRPSGWSAVRQQLATWEKPALLALLKALYEAAGVNRDFIQARCHAGQDGGEALETYRSKIVEQFFPAYGFGKLKLGEARDYRKATGNIPGADGRWNRLGISRFHRRCRRTVGGGTWQPGILFSVGPRQVINVMDYRDIGSQTKLSILNYV